MQELFLYNGFKLIGLELIDNNLLGTITYDFVDKIDNENHIYTTVIIGPNGTGKSNLFRTIIELLRELYNLNQGRNRVYQVKGRFKLKYSLNGDIYEFSNHVAPERQPINYKNTANVAFLAKNDKVVSFSEALFPIAIIANSLMITDKYPVFTQEEVFPQYKYLGVRNTPQNASTRSYVRKTVEFIIKNQDSEAFKKGLKKTTEFLGVNNAIEIYYSTINGNVFFNGQLDAEKFKEHYEAIRKKYLGKEYPPQKLNYYNRLLDNTDKINQIITFCNRLVNEKRVVKKASSTVGNITYNIISDESYRNLKAEGELLNELRQLGIISPPDISLNKGDSYALAESSSGEYHLFSSVVGLLATVKFNSLIFLDEPESSLHPNWQMKYLSLIRALFSDEAYGTSHIIVATHSHFLISDLKGDSSRIIGLIKTQQKEVNNINKRYEVVDLPYNIDTYGWSAEEVLYKIFTVNTTRNYYLENDLRELLYLISLKSDDFVRMNYLLNNIKILKFSENDPINLIIDKADNYLNR